MCRRHLTSLENFKLKVVRRTEVEDVRCLKNYTP
ncbi:hypothetical protein F383_39252 [Gossypium arboreum]|uniref:Uncharacterized protein n=1 Tax=Gossypium arboreum TaxID=29729 RepID=A0A0B0MRD3_GOSAR|nr:hypothetical protein F383_39252 [Gossypium arboreum]